MLKNRQCSVAKATIRGSDDYPGICGEVTFKQTQKGVMVTAEIRGLPCENDGGFNIFAFHIHSGVCCIGDAMDPFADADGHYNPTGEPHPYHAGDLPPLFGNNGYAYMSVLTDRFSVSEVIGKGVIVHSRPDDFTTQPAGNAGTKIACGKIV